ncbi:MAG: dihydrolipoyl dehydrogenase [Chloroflexi bacterium]|nr:dihydrolipoyl dehydrogenase [Chloroflexota bacterium]OJV92446.1 MAG: dihydrolipoyl dehydrogenase [Chloroflexi bacterium 54-19]
MVVGDVTTAVSTLVVGAGPGGYVAAIRAAQLGQSVTLVVDGPLGGICLNSGCIPLKALISASRRFRQLNDESLQTMGIQLARASFDWGQMQAWKTGVVERLSGGVAKLLAGHKIEIVHGLGWFLNEKELRVEGEYGSHRLAFEKCLLATGASPRELPELPFGENVLSAQQALALTELPTAINVVGDNYVALELATLFANLGVSTTLLAGGDKLLPEVDQAAVRLVQAGLRKLGIQVVTGAQALKMDGTELVYTAGGKEKRLAGTVVVSHGVKPNTGKLNLKEAGVKTGPDGELTVNAAQVTNQPDILAVGDVTGQTPLASVATKQAKVAAETMGGRKVAFAPQALPRVAHTTPELAYTGLTAEAATQAGYEVVTGRFPLAANGRGLTLGSESGVALVVAEKGSGLLLGMTLVGPQAGDLIMEASLGIEMGATLTDIAEILHPHPGLAEMTLESVESALGLAIHTL